MLHTHKGRCCICFFFFAPCAPPAIAPSPTRTFLESSRRRKFQRPAVLFQLLPFPSSGRIHRSFTLFNPSNSSRAKRRAEKGQKKATQPHYTVRSLREKLLIHSSLLSILPHAVFVNSAFLPCVIFFWSASSLMLRSPQRFTGIQLTTSLVSCLVCCIVLSPDIPSGHGLETVQPGSNKVAFNWAVHCARD